MKRSLLTLALLVVGTGAAFAAQPKQAPDAVQAPKGAVQAPTQSPAQSPVQKGGATARADSGYRTFSYEPGAYEPMRYSAASNGRARRAAWTNAATKALGSTREVWRKKELERMRLPCIVREPVRSKLHRPSEPCASDTWPVSIRSSGERLLSRCA